MFSLGEMLFIALIALVVVGPRQLPELARQLGRFINEMKRASFSFGDEFRISKDDLVKRPPIIPKSVEDLVKTSPEKRTEKINES